MKLLTVKLEKLVLRNNEFLKSYLIKQKNTSDLLIEAIEYSLLNSGKKIRANLVYLFGEMLKVDNKNLDFLASAVESIHCFSLIHDDLPAMDDDDIRRGKPSCHKKFNEAVAILAGDALNNMAFEMLSDDMLCSNISADKILKTIKQLSCDTGVNGIIAGQILDIQAENKTITYKTLKNIHKYKTASLMQSSVLLPYHISNFNDVNIYDNLVDFSYHIGILFQIRDDILDITSTTEILGKPANSDINNNKSTYPSVLGIDNAKSKYNEHFTKLKEILSKLEEDNFNIQDLTNFIDLVFKNEK